MEDLLPELVGLMCYHVLDGALDFTHTHPAYTANTTLSLGTLGVKCHWDCALITSASTDQILWSPCITNATACRKLFCRRFEVLSQLNRHWRQHVPWIAIVRHCHAKAIYPPPRWRFAAVPTPMSNDEARAMALVSVFVGYRVSETVFDATLDRLLPDQQKKKKKEQYPLLFFFMYQLGAKGPV